jgi:hypothetical protein
MRFFLRRVDFPLILKKDSYSRPSGGIVIYSRTQPSMDSDLRDGTFALTVSVLSLLSIFLTAYG